MNVRALRFRRLNLHACRGFEQSGFDLMDISNGVNLVYGPNASGKSTTAELFQQALWKSKADPRARFDVDMELPDGSWRVEFSGGQRTVLHDGRKEPLPALPSEAEADRYRMSLKELLEGANRQRSFAEFIACEAVGGFDIDAAAQQLHIDKPPAKLRRPQDLDAEVNQAEQAQKVLEARQRYLKQLESERRAAQEASVEVGQLNKAIERVELLAKKSEVEAKLEAIPELTGRLQGEEEDQLGKLEQKISGARQAISRARELQDEARHEMEETGLSDDGITDLRLDELRGMADRISTLEGKVEEASLLLIKARDGLKEASGRLPEDFEPSTLPTLQPAVLDSIENAATRLNSADERLEILKAERDELGDAQLVPDTGNARAAVQVLTSWLGSLSGKGNGLSLWVMAAAGAFLGGSIGAFVTHAWLIAAVLLAAATGLFIWAFVKRVHGNSSKASESRAELSHLGVAPPVEWTARAVVDRMQEVQADINAVATAEDHNRKVESARQQVDRQEKKREAALKEFMATAEQAGLGKPSGAVSALHLARCLHDWQLANEHVSEEVTAHDKLTGDLVQALQAWNADISEHGNDPSATTVEVQAAKQDLVRRAEKHREARILSSNAQEVERREQTELDTSVHDREALLQKLGLPHESEQADEVHHAIREAFASLDEYREQRQERRDLEAQLKRLEEQLADRSELLETSEPELQLLRQQAATDAGRLESINQEIGGINIQIADAKCAHSLENALANREAVLEKLARDTSARRHQLLGHILVEHLRVRTQRENLPPVFTFANTLFTQVTNGEFSLEWEPGENVLSAWDTSLSRVRSLEELSDGTRLQLHVCVRIAFLEQQEQGLALPLLLDELLANSDDERAERLVDALTVAQKKSGRQILYFTAQWDEILKWQRISRKKKLAEPTLLRMEEAAIAARTPIKGLLAQSTPAPSALDIPDPTSMTHAEFGHAMHVPVFDPRAEIDSFHLWYLIEDLPLLVELLRNRVTIWGQAKALRQDRPILGLTDDVWAKITSRADLFEQVKVLWARGRGKPVTVEILEDGGVSASFMERVIKIATKSDWDARSILEGAAGLPRFHGKTLGSMRAVFVEEGCLEDEGPLTAEEVWLELLSSIGGEMESGGLSSGEVMEVLRAFYPDWNENISPARSMKEND